MLREKAMHCINFIRGDVYRFRLHRDIQKFVGMILGLGIRHVGNYITDKCIVGYIRRINLPSKSQDVSSEMAFLT